MPALSGVYKGLSGVRPDGTAVFDFSQHRSVSELCPMNPNWVDSGGNLGGPTSGGLAGSSSGGSAGGSAGGLVAALQEWKEGAQPRESPQLAALRECAHVWWEGARSGVQLLRVRQGLELPKALPHGLRMGSNLFLLPVPRRFLTRFTELILDMLLLEGDGGMWDARRAGCLAPHHQHYVTNLASAAQLLKPEQTRILRTLRTRASIASTDEATALDATLIRALVSSVENLKACSPGGRLGSAGVMLRFTDEQVYPWMDNASLAPFMPSMCGSKVPHTRPDCDAPTPRRRRAASTIARVFSPLSRLTESATPTPRAVRHQRCDAPWGPAAQGAS